MPFHCIHCKSDVDPKYKACPFCGEPITDFLRRHLETPIDGKYQILARLGVGGMGEVYKVLHVHLNSIRVIKLMRSNIANDPGAHERFLREARLATKINHPNVATLFDFSTLDDGSMYMVWEYIEGINLHELIHERGPLSPRYAAMLSAQALHGLDAIHRAGIVHRDVSPENLMITRGDDGEERVKIIDLGIAKGTTGDDNKTKTGMFVGKWKYCSPEHLGMLPPGERIDGRADLYSFGIVLYEMLTGVPPFQADTPHAYLMMHASERPKPMREANPGVTAPPEVEALIARALEKDRNKRFASAREFAQAVERLIPRLTDEGGAPPPPPAATEVTDEATRVAPRDGDAATVVSVAAGAPAAPTVVSQKPIAERRLDRPTIPMGPPVPAAPERRSWIPIAAVLAILIAVGAWFMLRDDKPLPAAEPVRDVPVAAARLGINAFPWAEVRSIRNLDNGQTIETKSLVTPTPVDLPPGRYEVTLSNPNHPQTITRTIVLTAGNEQTLTVHFIDPANAKLPDFGGKR
ncbi:MAG TPA: protein kinase [Vicinamibacterales bacterium]|nr:protein kinase [Vicinamibacterales bacterium]